MFQSLFYFFQGSSLPEKDDKDYLSDDEASYDDNDDDHTDQGSVASGEQNNPYFSVKGVNQTFIPGKDVVLDCHVHDLGCKYTFSKNTNNEHVVCKFVVYQARSWFPLSYNTLMLE